MSERLTIQVVLFFGPIRLSLIMLSEQNEHSVILSVVTKYSSFKFFSEDFMVDL
ncbi:hypothetical protein [Polaribacter sp. R77954]|uniref:hypothetical protein n=1 Tax=Polaribacter sp. R77954 TaxID=3093870 RepID=UPI0037CA620A